MTKKSKEHNLKEKAQEYFDSLPDDPLVDGFDNFFVGDEAESLMKRGTKKIHDFQGMAHTGVEVEMEDDLDEFCPRLECCTKEFTFEIFYEIKSRVFGMFRFIELKSKELSHPVRKEDLIVTEDDHYLMDYLLSLRADFCTIESVAYLLAFRELGVLFARFKKVCGCPMCKAFNDKIFNVSEALEALCSGNQLVHKGCKCEWIPIFNRNQEYEFDIDLECWAEFKWFNVPLELQQDLYEATNLDFVGPLYFVDMGIKCEQEGIDTSSGFPVVLMDEKGRIFVHNGCIDGQGPVDYLREYVKEEKPVDLESTEIFLYKGREVYSKDGLYYDRKTGEVV